MEEITILTESQLQEKSYTEIQQIYAEIIGTTAPVATSKVNLISAILTKQEEKGKDDPNTQEPTGEEEEKFFVVLQNVRLDQHRLIAGDKINEQQSKKLKEYGLADSIATL
jgi:hypothetical protein